MKTVNSRKNRQQNKDLIMTMTLHFRGRNVLHCIKKYKEIVEKLAFIEKKKGRNYGKQNI